MMKTEEKYPLLLVYLEDDKNSKRSERIAAGATAVITKWPNDITASCWLGLLLVTFTIFLFFLMALSLNIEQHQQILSSHIIIAKLNDHDNLRCLKTIDDEISISDRNIYITHTSNKWTVREHNTLISLLSHYHDLNVTLIVLKNCNPLSNSTKNIENKLTHLYKEYPNLRIKYYNCLDYFNKTPLSKCWQNFSEPLINFVTRVLNLFEYSGMSFNLKTKLNNITDIKSSKLIKRNTSNNERSRRYIIDRNGVNKTSDHKNIIFPNIKMIPMDAVTLDLDGSFMATRTICHSFFEHILQQLKSHCHHNLISVQKLITDSLHVFCNKSVSDDSGGNITSIKYCDIY
ncbi:uncharacterized protein LOC123296106 [Chrysoperla carnea]|uniref:uncharacterized protein LOC123296106 n=1 Tax=Chrysoperla carnea TaxID=189513 RepID=UPI001D08BD95|nr:uncharacterized protein LOC123296106 [Chrysoperla carnea]